MSSAKALTARTKSVKNIQQITQSMKVVSAVKLAQAQKNLNDGRAMGESTKSFYEKLRVREDAVQPKIPRLIMAITSDKGMCGPVHLRVAKAVEQQLAYISGESKVICVGNMSKIRLQSTVYSNKIALVVQNYGRIPPTFLDASRIAIETFRTDFDFAKIIYNKFKNVVVHAISYINVYSKHVMITAPEFQVYEETDIDSYLEFSLAAIIYYTLLENLCSETASRMNSMDTASKNSGKFIKKLASQANRKRQAEVTQELMEIMSGAEAVAPSKS